MTESTPDIKKNALEIINAQHVMTIASSDNDAPWSAPVYYIFDKGLFYFFSKPSSRHIEDSLKTGKAAASLHSDSFGWSDICGLQMSGSISATGINPKSGKAFNTFIKRFKFISEIKNAVSDIKDIASLESAFRVKFYNFKPETVYYLDNSIRFGFKEKVSI